MALDSLEGRHPLEGLQKDPATGHYLVQPGYGHQAHRYRIDDTWLDEDDNMWIKGEAVEREGREFEGSGEVQ